MHKEQLVFDLSYTCREGTGCIRCKRCRNIIIGALCGPDCWYFARNCCLSWHPGHVAHALNMTRTLRTVHLQV